MIDNSAIGQGVNTFYLGLIVGKDDGSFHFTGFFLENRTSLRMALTDNNRNSFLDDTCFLGSNLGERISKELGMVKTDIGNDRDEWGNDVSTVETSSETNLNNCNVNASILKIFESHCRSHLKKRRVERFKERTLFFYEINHIILTDRIAVNTNTFTEINEMGGRVKSHPITTFLENGCDGMRDTAFTIGSCHMDGGK